MTHKRPRDPNQLAKLIVDIASGEVPDEREPPKPVTPSKSPPKAMPGSDATLNTRSRDVRHFD
jgi:hypothetical protein